MVSRKILKVVRYDDLIGNEEDEGKISEKMVEWFNKIKEDLVLSMSEGEDYVVLKNKNVVVENNLEKGWIVWDYLVFMDMICSY